VLLDEITNGLGIVGEQIVTGVGDLRAFDLGHAFGAVAVDTPNRNRRAPPRRRETSFSQGAEWKALMSKYIGTMPLSSGASGPAEQSKSGVPPRTGVSSAMVAKVGAAARDRQSAVLRAAAASHSPVICIVIFEYPFAFRHCRWLSVTRYT
jgi:hypothetical protein